MFTELLSINKTKRKEKKVYHPTPNLHHSLTSHHITSMGSYITKPIEERQRSIYIQQQLVQLKQSKYKRDYQLASRVAMLRDRTFWMIAFYFTMGTVSLARMVALRSFSPLPLKTVPYVLVPFLVAYQVGTTPYLSSLSLF